MSDFEEYWYSLEYGTVPLISTSTNFLQPSPVSSSYSGGLLTSLPVDLVSPKWQTTTTLKGKDVTFTGHIFTVWHTK